MNFYINHLIQKIYKIYFHYFLFLSSVRCISVMGLLFFGKFYRYMNSTDNVYNTTFRFCLHNMEIYDKVTRTKTNNTFLSDFFLKVVLYTEVHFHNRQGKIIIVQCCSLVTILNETRHLLKGVYKAMINLVNDEWIQTVPKLSLILKRTFFKQYLIYRWLRF